MNKKGFTLVEIIIVVALVALVMLLVIPNVAGQFGKAKKDIFYADVVNIVTMATNTYIKRASIDITTPKEFTNSSNPLDVDIDEDITYYVKVDSDGNVISIEVINNDFYYFKTGTSIKKKDINKSEITESEGHSITEALSPNRYVYWTSEQGGNGVLYNSNEVPATTFDSYEELKNGVSGEFIRTKLENNIPVKHEVCIILYDKYSCIEKDYWTGTLGQYSSQAGDNTALKLQSDMERDLETTARQCVGYSQSASCIFYNSSTLTACKDGTVMSAYAASRVCKVTHSGQVSCSSSSSNSCP